MFLLGLLVGATLAFIILSFVAIGRGDDHED